MTGRSESICTFCALPGSRNHTACSCSLSPCCEFSSHRNRRQLKDLPVAHSSDLSNSGDIGHDLSGLSNGGDVGRDLSGRDLSSLSNGRDVGHDLNGPSSRMIGFKVVNKNIHFIVS